MVRDAKEYPTFEITSNGGKFELIFLDNNKIHIHTNWSTEYIGNYKVYTGTYIVNGVNYIIDAFYKFVEGEEVKKYWWEHIHGDESAPKELWVPDAHEGYQLRRADYYSTNKWVSDSAATKMRNDIMEAILQYVKEHPERLIEAHETKRWNDIRQKEKEIAVKQEEIQDLFETIKSLEEAQ